MRRQQVLDLLRLQLDEIRRRFHVSSLVLFGSHARDEAREESDVDLLVDFETVPSWAEYNALIDFLEELLGTSVDLLAASKLKPRWSFEARSVREQAHRPLKVGNRSIADE
ncbi:MAG: nucleotidyltransferase family protein, partial [Gemmatimonadetes bacterium]|nr:nucleotidyltransferase family protein [Gemmatimonadota bacterium]